MEQIATLIATFKRLPTFLAGSLPLRCLQQNKMNQPVAVTQSAKQFLLSETRESSPLA